MNPPTREELVRDLGLNRAREALSGRAWEKAWPSLCELSHERLVGHGNFPRYAEAISSLPSLSPSDRALNEDAPRVGSPGLHNPALEAALRKLNPWKKGPFEIHGTKIDAEWQSHHKWQRVQEVASPLSGRKVLDVGTGNGYFLLRAAGDGATFTLGLEPSVHYTSQYLAINRYFECEEIGLLPLTSDEFVQDCATFDTVLSMGVLYHRRSPLDHIAQLKGFLRSGGELILETIVVDGPLGHTLVPEGRYAQMRNVWFLPSVPTIESWLRRLGMKNIRTTSSIPTGSDEQRSTTWTEQPSLTDFLDPADRTRTIEGHPAPQRAIFLATAP